MPGITDKQIADQQGLQASPGRHYHSTLSSAVVGCHALGLHSNLAGIAASFCPNDSAALGYDTFGDIGTALSKKIGVFQPSPPEVAPVSPNAPHRRRGRPRQTAPRASRRRAPRCRLALDPHLSLRFAGRGAGCNTRAGDPGGRGCRAARRARERGGATYTRAVLPLSRAVLFYMENPCRARA